MNKRVVTLYQDITITEITHSDGEMVFARPYSVRIGSDLRAFREFQELDSARDYFDVLVLERLNCITSAVQGHH